MKKIKLNRFSIITICVSLTLLLLFVVSNLRTYSDYVTRPASKIDGDTVYINDLASDYYYYLGMNYVGDIDSTSRNYQPSDLKMVTINYYGYPSNNPDQTGYVSLTERQNKYVYYKYYPISGGQITIDLIDNPFMDRPKNKGFNGWTSSQGTITTDSYTKVQRMTISSSVDTINVYASWADANIIYLKGSTGDDNLDGTRPDKAVGSWSKAFQLLESHTSDSNNRELNIIVLAGNVNYAINYSQGITQSYNSVTYTYEQYDDYDEKVLLAYRSGNNYYALNDNYTNVQAVQLTSTTEPAATAEWYVTRVNGGYTIRNASTNRYLNAVQYYNDQIALVLNNTEYVWDYDGDIDGFYKEFQITYTLYHYNVANTINSGSSYVITSGNTQNALNGEANNLVINDRNFVNTIEWRFQNTGGNNYTIYNVGDNRYLNYSNANNTIALAYGNALNWTYDSANKMLSTTVTHREVNDVYGVSNIAIANGVHIGYVNNSGQAVVLAGNGNSNTTQHTINVNGTFANTDNWNISSYNGGYRIRNASNNRSLARNGTTVTMSNTAATWHYDTTNHRLYTTSYNNTYYLYNNNGTWALTTTAGNATAVYSVALTQQVNTYDELMYLAYDNGWKLENTNTHARLDILSYTSEQITEMLPYYVRYDSASSNFTIGNNTNGATIKKYIYHIERDIRSTTTNNVGNNSYYSSSTNIAATITSLYNHVDYRDDATWTLTSASSSRAQVVARKDLQLEYLKINATGYQIINDDNAQTNYQTSYASLIGNRHNVRLGRGMTPLSWDNTSNTVFCFAMGGPFDAAVTNNDSNKYRFVIETGRYSGLFAYDTYNNRIGYNYYGQMEWVLGNDYDRITNNNENMEVYFRTASSTYNGVFGRATRNLPAYIMTVKSGTYGVDFFDNNPNSGDIAYSGFYVGGLLVSAGTNTRDRSSRVLIVEGGIITNINGGLRIIESDGNSGVATRIYVKGGKAYNIVGGAGLSTTYGNRYISVTGGEVSYSVTGGSNGYLATGSGQDGKIPADTYVHIGGEAKIGTKGSGSLYLVNYGSVLGAGNGKENVESGQINNTHVSISDDAVIYGNVYGGGNYGYVSNSVDIKIDGGTIHGNVYGGANRNGIGSVRINNNGTASNKSGGNVTITMNDGEIKNTLYGGSCETGDIAGVINITINGGTIGYNADNNASVFGGGYGEDTNVASGVNIIVNDNKNVNITGTVYGGSALGTVIGNISVSAVDDNDTGNITMSGDVYCGSMGDSSISSTGSIYGNCTLSLDGGTYSGRVYGGNNANGSPNGVVTVNVGGDYNTDIENVFGGGNEADSTASSVTVNIKEHSDVTNAYGGGNKASVSNTNVNLINGHVDNLFGGSNETGNITSSHVTVTGGTADNIYGGNNLGGSTTTSNITVSGGNVTTIYGGNNLGGTTATSNITVSGGTVSNLYGGGNEATTGTSYIYLNNGNVTNTYGGGNKAGMTVSTNISLAGSTCTNIYGGSNTSGNILVSNITATSGSATNIYGGNNVGGRTETTNITITNVQAENVYGGGSRADTNTNNVTINGGTITNVYGGGESANVDTKTNVNVYGGTTTNVFGGSNTTGNVPVSDVKIHGGTVTTVYGGNNAGGTTVTTNVTINSGTVTNAYGGGNAANSTTTNVTLNNSTNQLSYIFGGCREANATTTNVTLNNGRADNVFGGSNTSGTITNSYVTVNGGNYQSVYGGNNDGGKTITTAVSVLGGTTNTVFGGGNNAETDHTTVLVDNANVAGNLYGGGNNAAVNNDTYVTVQNGSTIASNLYGGGNNGVVLGNTNVVINTNSGVTGNIFGGGNNAAVNTNSNVLLEGATVSGNLYGGGNNGVVLGNTYVNIKNGQVLSSAYAGGNGETATVNQNTTIVVQGTSRITNHVFGGGNAAQTGNSADDSSMGVVNITGATIGGNVYGGANTSVLYGETVVNIGYDAVTTYTNSTNYVRGNIIIGGTVFGGGEANESGSEVYDFDFISVTKGIIINIDGHNHDAFTINGSIFGSGNASRTTGYSRVYINNYGSATDIKNNVSLQRADIAVINNSHLALSGATDRTNEYSQVVFSVSRITELVLKNNSEIFMESGANLLTHFRSLNSNDTLAVVNIDEDTHEVYRSTNNRLYIKEDKVLNIALNQNVTAYGEVDGMTFFGMFRRDRNGNIVKALYNTNYLTGDSISNEEMYYFNSGSYVLGLHETNHDIHVDGFYTNYDDPNNPGHVLVDYITPTPENAEHYMWTIGVNIQSYDIELIASKYSTLGTYEFPFINNTSGNTTFTVVGFSYDTLDPDVSLINPDSVPRIAETNEDADNIMGLAIKPGIGWVNVGRTVFLTDSTDDYDGIVNYKSENSNVTPSFVFYLYHSKNLQTEGLVGNVIISFLVVTPIDDLTNNVERINFNVTISRAIFDTNDYEGAMTPGRQYEMFTSSKMDITSKSSLSAYYSLYMENPETIYLANYHRVLTSNVMLPVNTKITMIDFASATKPEYYYYIVSAADNAAMQNYYNLNNEVSYPLDKFIRMGSLDDTNTYNNALANSIYYDTTHGRAIEEFIFIVDFKDANVTSDMLDCSLLIELLDSNENVIHSVLGIQRSNLVYSLHANQQGVISVDASVSKSILYAGDTEDLRVSIDFNQSDNQQVNRIVDTTYYEQKLGLKITFLNEQGNVVNGVDLMGTSLTLDGVTYYASSDGTFRFKVADRVANAYSNIRVNTQNSYLAAGLYTIKVEAFYSPDGIYFGMTPADTDEAGFRMMNKSYGLEVNIPEEYVIIDKDSGNNVNNGNTLTATVNYSGLLIHPKLRVALYRRTYNDIYAMDYVPMFLNEYIDNDLPVYNSNIYTIIDSLQSTNTCTLTFDTGLVSGTYKLEFRLYDDDAYVGNVIKYIIIK